MWRERFCSELVVRKRARLAPSSTVTCLKTRTPRQTCCLLHPRTSSLAPREEEEEEEETYIWNLKHARRFPTKWDQHRRRRRSKTKIPQPDARRVDTRMPG